MFRTTRCRRHGRRGLIIKFHPQNKRNEKIVLPGVFFTPSRFHTRRDEHYLVFTTKLATNKQRASMVASWGNVQLKEQEHPEFKICGLLHGRGSESNLFTGILVAGFLSSLFSTRRFSAR